MLAAAAFSAAVLSQGCERLPDAKLDMGGLTFDFAAYSESRFHIPKPGEDGNLVTTDAKWKSGMREVHRSGLAAADPVRKALCSHVGFSEKDGVREVHNDAGLLAVKAPWENAYRNASGSWRLQLPLPDAKGGTYRIACRYQQRHNASHEGYLGGILIWFDGVRADGTRGRTEGGRYEVWQFSDSWGAWNLFEKTFQVAPGTDSLDIRVRGDGVADVKFADLGVFRATAGRPVSVKLMPHGLFDGTYALAQGQATMLAYVWKKSCAKDAFVPGKFLFTLRLPSGVEYMGDSFADSKTRRVVKAGDGSTVVSFAPVANRTPGVGYTGWDKLTVLVRCDNPPPWRGDGAMTLTYDGRDAADEERTRFFAVEPVRAAAVPKTYRNGVVFAGRPHEFGDGSAEKSFADTMAAAGVGWIVAGACGGKRAKMWHEAGIPVVTLYSSFANGYYLGYCANRPEGDRFVSDGKEGPQWSRYLSMSTCPMAVYEERPFFVTNTVPALAKSLEETDGMWANWEPFMFRGHGCFCQKCNAAFDEWHAKTGGSREKFRSIQHGKMVKTIDKYVRAATGGEKSLGFIPGVSWREVASSWHERRPSPESEPIDYAGDLAWLDAWGPYVYWDTTSPYNPRRSGPLAHFIAAKDMRETVDADFPLPRRPKLLSFPQGMQSAGWATQPEWLEMACDSFFFNGFEANTVYFFPEGYDARYWKAFASATERAAKYERFVVGGTRRDADTELVPVAEYAPPCAVVTSFLPKWRNVPMLQQATWESGDGRIVAALNFWERGEAFFRVKVRGLASGRYYVVDEDGVLYVPGGVGKSWTAEPLAKGDLMLCVGAARTKVFEVVPADRPCGPFRSRMTAGRMASLYASRRAVLAKFAAEDVAAERDETVPVDTKGEL